jgi:hypothetical protein
MGRETKYSNIEFSNVSDCIFQQNKKEFKKMKTLLFGLATVCAIFAQGGTGVEPRFGTTFDRRVATNELGSCAITSTTFQPLSAFVDDGHGGWALDGSKFATKGVKYEPSLSGWKGELTGNAMDQGAEKFANFVLSMRAKIGDSADQVLWYLRYGNAGVGAFLRTVRNKETGKLDLSLEWSGSAAWTPYTNIVLSAVDTTDYHVYVLSCMTNSNAKLYVDGVVKWSGGVTCWNESSGTPVEQGRSLSSKSYRSLWLGAVESKTNVGTGDWTTVYDDVRFYSTNEGGESAVPTEEEIVALTDVTKAQRDVASLVPSARLTVTFNDKSLADSAGVLTNQFGAETLASRAFRANTAGGHSLDAARLPSGQQGACLYEQGRNWSTTPIDLCGTENQDASCVLAVSLVAKIAAANDAAVCFLRNGGNVGCGLVLYTLTNTEGGTDLALAWLDYAGSAAYPHVLAKNIDTENYHHYVFTRSSGNTLPFRLWIDNAPVDLFTETKLTCYYVDSTTKEIKTKTRQPTEKSFPGFYLAAARGATGACSTAGGTCFGDVRFFAGANFTDGYCQTAISPEGIDALYRTLMPYADAPNPGLLMIIR